MVAVEALTCGYTQPVLKEISFKTAENLVILGSNGAGKSTLAKALCGLLDAQGEVIINNKPLKTLSPIQRAQEITYIPPKLESYDSYITVLEFVLMGRHPYKAPYTPYTEEETALAHRLIDLHTLDATKKIGELSSGQQQLLLITQALAQESRIIIFDEPTANLDPKHSLEFYRSLQSLSDTTQKILITHDLNLAYKLGYEVLFIKGDGAEHYPDPQTFFTATQLEAAYGLTFEITERMLGVRYE